jgi:hypothetical protein
MIGPTNASSYVYIEYNWDFTKKKEKDKRWHDPIADLRECPTLWGLHPEAAAIVDRRDTSIENA